MHTCPSCRRPLTPLGIFATGPNGERLERHNCSGGCGQFDVGVVRETEHRCHACGHEYVEQQTVGGGASQLPGEAPWDRQMRVDQLGFPPLR